MPTSGGDRRRGGFTLLEMLVVLAVIGLLAAVAIPRAGSGDATRARGAAAVVARTVAEARLAAQTGGVGKTVIVGADGGLRDAGGAAVTLPRGASLSPASTLAFHPDGSMSDATIEVAAGSERRTVAIDGVAGRIARR